MTYSPSTANIPMQATIIYLNRLAAEHAPNTKFIFTENIQYDSMDTIFSVYCQTCNNRLDQVTNRRSDIDDLSRMVVQFAKQHAHTREPFIPIEPKVLQAKIGRKFR